MKKKETKAKKKIKSMKARRLEFTDDIMDAIDKAIMKDNLSRQWVIGFLDAIKWELHQERFEQILGSNRD